MEELIVAILVIVVLWLVAKQRGRSSEREKLDELESLVLGLDARLSRVEKGARAVTPGLAAQAATAPPPPAATAPPPPVPMTPVPVTPPSGQFAPAWSAAWTPESKQAASPATEPKAAAAAGADAARVQPPAAVSFAAAAVPAPPPPASWAQQIETPEPMRSVSIEERLGQNWLNKLGIVTLVIGLALFLGYRVRTWGPLGKSMIGLALSLALLGGGLLLERLSRYRIFARAAIGGGWALAFFVTFALYHVDAMRVLPSQGIDLVLMMTVATAMVWHSLRYKSQVVTGLAFLLAFVTVGVSEVTLFSLVAGALLAAGLVLVAAREYWFELGLAGLVGAYLNHYLWLRRVLPEGGQAGQPFPQFFASAGLLILYWLIFRLFYVLRVPRDEREQAVSSLAAVLNSAALLSLLKFQSARPEWTFWGLLGLGVAELVLAFVARRRWRTAFVVLSSIASVLLLAAVPFRFGGSDWSLLWLLQAEVLFVAGLRMPEIVFRRLGLIAGFAAFGQTLTAGVAPIFVSRQLQTDASTHWPVAIVLLVAAILFWFNAEFATRRWEFVAAEDLDLYGLRATSYLALLAVGLGLWVCVPAAWTVVAWLLVALVLGWLSDRLDSADLATQSDLLALGAVVRAVAVNLFMTAQWGWLTSRAVTVTLAAALLYVAMRRKTRAHLVEANYIPAVYSWAACGLLATLAWYELRPISVAVAWGVFGLVLFELGIALRRGYFRHQGYALLAASFIRIFFANLNDAGSAGWLGPRVYTVVPLIAAYFWVYERLQSEQTASSSERDAAGVAAWAGTVAATALVYFEVRAEWVALAWASLALLTVLAGWALKRTVFVAQALTLLAASAVRALMFNLLSPAPLAVSFLSSRAFSVGAACGLMLLALPMAFGVRKQHAEEAANEQGNWGSFTVFRPEQAFFFVPLVLVTLLLAMDLRAGMITVGWSALGVVAFLVALAVGERSYRLAGLSLLLLGAGKIVCVDIWKASPSDRYITLIVMGVAMLLVSFLYSRNRDTILKFL